MAHSNNAQREPSMEEILASIRRIIEDSDTTRRTPDPEAEPALDEAEQSAAQSSNVHAFRAGLHEDLDQPQPAPAPRQETPAEAPAPFRTSAFSAPDFGFPGTGAPAEGGASEADEIEVELGDFTAEDHHEAPDHQEATAHPEAPAPVAKPAAEQAPTIMSEHAGRQVAASFNELSAAFEARSRRSFDDIAAEMMRPMLQDWLDNNLPHLVERLVREEIERIARGGPAQR